MNLAAALEPILPLSLSVLRDFQLTRYVLLTGDSSKLSIVSIRRRE